MTIKRFWPILIILLIFSHGSFAAEDQKDIQKKFNFLNGPFNKYASSVVHKQFNFHIVDSGIWRSSKPNKESLLRMRQYGLKTIINLRRSRSFHNWEKQYADNLGVNYYNFPMSPRIHQDYNELKDILNIIRDPSNQPVLIHCREGKDRTGLIVALYKLQLTKATFDEVHREMLMYGYDEEKYPKIIETVRLWYQMNNGEDKKSIAVELTYYKE